MPLAEERVQAIRECRFAYGHTQAKKAADIPNHFGPELLAESESLSAPRVCQSSGCMYVPKGFIDPNVLCRDLAFPISDATLYDFGMPQSQFCNAWMRIVAGRLRSDYRYSDEAVCSSFVWSSSISAQRQTIERTAWVIRGARAIHPAKSLVEFCESKKMSSDLRAAHKALYRTVEGACDVDSGGDERRIATLRFKHYATAARKQVGV